MRPGRNVVLKKRSGSRWVKVAAKAADEHGGATFDLTAGAPGAVKYRAFAGAQDKAPKIGTDTRTVDVVDSGDVAPPPVPAGIGVVLDGEQVQVSWGDVSSDDLAGYHVHRAETEHGPWLRQTDLPQATTEYVDQPGGRDDYWYAVTSVDDLDNESERSSALQPTPADHTSPAAPTGLTATPGDGQVDLSWDAVTATDLAGYHVERTATGAGTWTRLTTNVLSQTSYTDNSATNDTAYTYRVVAVDTASNESGPSDTASATPADTTAPAVPTGLTATPGDGEVALNWDAVTATDLAGYHVERTPTGANSWTRLTTNPVAGTTYTDSGAVNGTAYTYRVVAVDTASNESDPSGTASATPADTTPPAAPTGLTATSGDSQVQLTWNTVTATDLAGYHVERRTGAGSWNRLTTELRTQNSLTDTGAVNDTTYAYRVLAVDNADNESGPSDTQFATPTDTTPPAVPTGLTVRPWNSVVAIGWSPVTASDLAGYNVLMATDPAGPWQVLNSAPVTDTSHFQTQLTNGTGYFFSIVSVDSHGNRSAQATPVSATPAQRAISLDAGNSHSCRVRADESLACWGAGFVGDGTQTARAVPTPVGGTWQSVSTGSSHSCGVRTDATLWCWGHNFYGQVGDGTELNTRLVPTQVGNATWKVVAAGGNTSCAVRTDGSLWCWGNNGNGQLGDGTTTNRLAPTQVGSASDWRDVSLGGAHTCGIRTDGTIWCWGYNFNGELGDGTTTNRVSPTRVGTATSWTSLSAGENQTCATRNDGTAWCWGANSQGQLGDGTRVGRTTPTQVGTGTNWTTVSTGNGYTCGLRGLGDRWCWGANFYGQLGNGTASPGAFNPLVPIRVGNETWNEISAGGNTHTCAVKTDGSAWCWGRPRGALGAGHFSYEVAPHQVPGSITDWAQLESGALSSCGIARAGSMWCSGLTAGTTSTKFTQFGTASDWSDVTTGTNHVCGLRGAGTLWCAGQNDRGQLGTNGTPGSSLILQVGTDSDWTDVEASSSRTCGVRSNGTAWCWGDNFYGQVGDGTSRNTRLVPTQVGTATDWASLSVGYNHTCALRTNGSLWCWGENRDGQLGDGTTTTERTTPVQVGTATTWATVSAGYLHTCGTRTDGTLWCWGYNGASQLGDGSTTGALAPTRVGTESDWDSVSAGESHTCGTRTSGTLWCWGANYFGQLGDGTGTDRAVPTQIGTGSWTGISSRNKHTCGVRTDGTGWCWGDNSNNQLGFFNGSTVPVAVIE